jgi:PAS domain S-box-containing protein
MKSSKSKTKATNLRQKAEKMVKPKTAEFVSLLSHAEILKQTHELQVHQIELELQQEELVAAREQALAEAEKYTELFDFAPTGYFTLSQEGKIIDCNLCGSQIVNVERSQLKNKLLGAFITNDAKPTYNKFLHNVFSGTGQESCTVTFSVNDHPPRYVYLTGIAISIKQQCLATAVDITERKLVEEALVKSEEEFRAVTQTAIDAIITVNSHGIVLGWNGGAEKMFGYSMKDIIGKELTLIIPRNYAAQHKEYIKQVLNSGHPRVIGKTVELSGLHKTGKEFPIELSLAQWETRTGKFFTGIIRDITERKRFEQEIIIAKERAEENDRLKTAFLHNMSHEIRTPMSAIMGFSELLAEKPNDPLKIQQYTNIICKSAGDLLEIINAILDIAQIESGQMPIHMEEGNLKDLFAELALLFQAYQKRIDKQDIQFSLHALDDSLQNLVIMDKGKIKQIFINLISNAFKFTKSGRITGGCRLSNNNLIFFVSDTGIGIPADDQKLIFERFVQITRDNVNNNGGTGLGLSIVKGLVKLLGSEIQLESKPGAGSTFSFALPYKQAIVPHSPVTAQLGQGKYHFHGQTVLIVEDDHFNSEYLKAVLADTDAHILHSDCGKNAVQLALSESVDLILMDIRLPDFDGYEATRQILQQKPDSKIIAQTAYAMPTDKNKALAAGCIDFISKPAKKALLLAMINRHLKHKAANA